MMTKKYNLSFDVLTILACFMVVVFHCNGVVYNCSDTISWKISVAVRCIVYSAIPIFFMLTGAKLLPYRERYSTKEYAKKRLQRVGVPFLFWNVFYVLYNLKISSGVKFNSVKEFISRFVNSEFQGRYWFFWPLFAVYLAIPVVSLILKAENHRKYLWYTVYLSFGLTFVLRPVMEILGIEYNSYLDFPIAADFMMYVIFGYLISTESWSLKKRGILYFAAAISGIFAVYFTVTKSLEAGVTQRYLFSYEFFPSALTGAAIFVFVKHLFENSERLSSLSKENKAVAFTRTVSDTCMGVWLTHSLAINVLLTVVPLDYKGYIFRFIGPFLIFAACFAGVYVVKKIPFFRRIV